LTYKPSEIAELLERMDRREKLDLVEQEVAKRMLAKQPPRPMFEEQPQLTRSTMSAADKSRYIRQHGRAKYDALPWN
jgi:hypothetical protein